MMMADPHTDSGLVAPAALREQACIIGKTGSTVTIECDDADEANELFEWLADGHYLQAADRTAQGREMVLEEAAKKAESIGEQYGEDETGWFECSETVAAAIRALKEPTP
jgi:hypothetical protein